jgi:hypothetical protein
MVEPEARLGGIVSHAPHPKGGALKGAPQMLEVSRDGRRVLRDKLALFRRRRAVLSGGNSRTDHEGGR